MTKNLSRTKSSIADSIMTALRADRWEREQEQSLVEEAKKKEEADRKKIEEVVRATLANQTSNFVSSDVLGGV